MSRRGFLGLGGAGLLAATALSAGCGGAETGEPTDTTSEGPEAPQGAFEIPTPRGTVRGVLHPTGDVGGAFGAAVMVGGAGGSVWGPAGVYEELADLLQGDGTAALRLEYREPNDLDECVYDTMAGIEDLVGRGAKPVVVVGWSFGGAVAISAGAASEEVVGVATVASQTSGTEAVGELAPAGKSLLLMHGTADDVLPYRLSEYLYAAAGEPKRLVLYPGDGHGIEIHRRQMLEELYGWSRGLLLRPTGR